MAAQNLLVFLIVGACSGYAAWTLMPHAARRAIASRLLRLALPPWLAKPLRRTTQSTSACGGCNSCGDGDSPASSTPQAHKVTLHRRLPR